MHDKVKSIPDISLSTPRFQNEADEFARDMASNIRHFFQALITSPIYMEWMPAGKLAYIFLGASLLKY